MTHHRRTFKEELLIDLVKQNSVLYNPDHMLYFDKVHKFKLWMEIANQFKNVDAHECKQKWKILREQYKRHSKKRGRGKHTNKFMYARNMRFLEDYCLSDDEVENIHKSKTHFAIYSLTRAQYENLIDITYGNFSIMSDEQPSTSSAQPWPQMEYDRNGQLILDDYDDEEEEANNCLQRLSFKGFTNTGEDMSKVEVFRVIGEYDMIRICGTNPRNLGRILRIADSDFPPFDISPGHKTYATYVHPDNPEPEGGVMN